MKQPSALGVWAPLVTLWIVWGSTYLGLSEVVKSMPPLIATGSRYFVASLCLGIGVLVFRGLAPFRITRRELYSTAIMGLGIISIWAAALALGQRYVPGGIAALIGASIPLWIVLLRLLNGDRPSRLTGAGVIIGIAGIALMLLPGGIVSVSGAAPGAVLFWCLAILVGCISWAFFSCRAKSFAVPANSLVTATLQMLMAGAALVAVGILIGERIEFGSYLSVSVIGWIWLVIASIIGYSAFTFLIARAPISLVSTFPYVNPVVAVLLGWLVLAEPFSRSILIGLTVVLGGVVLVVKGERA